MVVLNKISSFPFLFVFTADVLQQSQQREEEHQVLPTGPLLIA